MECAQGLAVPIVVSGEIWAYHNLATSVLAMWSGVCIECVCIERV